MPIWGTIHWKIYPFLGIRASSRKITPNWSLRRAAREISLTFTSLASFLFQVTACSSTQTHTLNSVSDTPKIFQSCSQTHKEPDKRWGSCSADTIALYQFLFYICLLENTTAHHAKCYQSHQSDLRRKSDLHPLDPSHILWGAKTIL